MNDITKRLTEIRSRYEQVVSTSLEWRTEQDAVDAIGAAGHTVWAMVEPARTAVRLATALQIAVQPHEPQTSANGVKVCGRCSAVAGALVRAPCDEMKAIAAALTPDTEEAQ